MAVTLWKGVAVNVQSAAATAVAATGITKANPAVVSHAGTDPADGNYVLMDVLGMSQINSRVFRVDNQASGTFQLEGVDSTAYSTFSSGTFSVLTMGTSVTTFTDLSASGGDFSFEDTSTIHALDSTQIPNKSSPAEYSFTSQWDPADAGLIALKALSDAQSLAAWEFIFANGRKMLFNGYVGATLLPVGSAGGLVTTNVVVTMFGRPTVYAS